MATRGVNQLLKLSINYCEYGGSSAAVRECLRRGIFIQWAEKYPHVQIYVQRRNGNHPFIAAEYVTTKIDPCIINNNSNSLEGKTKEEKKHLKHYPQPNQPQHRGIASHQITVKNAPHTRDIVQVMDMLRNRSARKITKITTPVLSDTPSIQGVWTPFLNLSNEPPFVITIHE
jgi:hypothetical protein